MAINRAWKPSEPDQFRHEIELAVLDVTIQLAHELHPDQELGELRSSDSLQDSFGIDSMGRAELGNRIERAFGVRLSDSVLGNAESPDDLISALMTHKEAAIKIVRPERPEFARAHLEPVSPAGPPAHARTLVEVLFWYAEKFPNRPYLEFVDTDGKHHSLTYGQLARSSQEIAAGLKQRGLSPKEPVALILPTSLEFFFSFFGVLLAGGIPVPLYPPDRPSKLEDYIHRQSGILANCEARFLVTTEAGRKLSHLIGPRLPLRSQRPLEIVVPSDLKTTVGQIPFEKLAPENTAFIQYTSGSTGDPKGVVLSHSNILANVRAMGKTINANSSDVFVSWLPLYHDMGLIGACLGILYYGAFLALVSPITFLLRPSRWLWMIHDYRATLSAAPNFAYELCAKRVTDAELGNLDLSTWRIAFNGAEPVSAGTIQRFTDRFRRTGFQPESMTPVYGLAESSVGLAFSPPGRAPRIENLRRGAFLRFGHALRAAPSAATEEAVTLVSSGFPLPGHTIRVVDAEGRTLPDRKIGQIEFQGPSSTSGYYRNTAATRALLRHEPWLDTGDLGFLSEGELFIAGRAKDVIIRAGRQAFPQELEDLIGNLPLVRKGCVVVFGVQSGATGTERIIIAAETRSTDESEKATLRTRIAELSASTLEIPADEVLLLAPRSIPKTSSGKLRRNECARLYEKNRLTSPPSPARQWLRIFRTNLLLRTQRILNRTRTRLSAFYLWAVAIALTPPFVIGIFILRSFSSRFAYARLCARMAFRVAGLRLEVVNRRLLPTPSIFVANHASYIDVVALAAALPGNFHVVAKKEFESHWFFGPIFRRLGCIFVERFDSQAALKSSHLMEEPLGKRETLLLFPEGTFTSRAALQPFHLGAFVTAAKTGTPLIPVAIQGTRSVLGADSWMPRRHPIRITVFPTLYPKGAGWEESLRLQATARQAIAGASGETQEY